jgi:exopolysaccharide biosynthesis polyprenyl glycosylphosphotransferase
MLESRPDLGYRITGFADQEWFGLDAFRASGYNLVTDLDDLPRFLRNSVVDEVMVALPFRSMHEQASRVAASCEKQGITVRVLPTIFDLKIARSSAEEFEGDPFITHSTGWADGWPVVAKRIVDLIVSAIAIAALFPLLLLVAVLIKVSSSGKVLFIQKRVGLHKRRFSLYKFRTMVADAEQRITQIERLNEVSGPVFKMKADPRITQVGRLLRKTSIDELPQLFNVLVGDMSLVGPRPLPVRDYEGFNEDWQRRRFSVRPGITCLWQVNGRSNISFDHWMKLDLQYLDEWSLWLDAKILAQTIPAVMKGSGAA